MMWLPLSPPHTALIRKLAKHDSLTTKISSPTQVVIKRREEVCPQETKIKQLRTFPFLKKKEDDVGREINIIFLMKIINSNKKL